LAYRGAAAAGQVPVPKRQIQKTGPERGAPLAVIFTEQTNGSAMTRFFFHVRDDGDDVSRDTEGQELPDLEAARREALNSNREMLGESLLHGGSLDHRQIEIANEQGEILAVLKAEDTLYQGGELRSFSDDVTKSAPKTTTSSNPGSR
jgi:hypothetical protein